MGDTFGVRVDLEQVKGLIPAARRELQAQMRDTFVDTVNEARDRVAELTPQRSGATAKRWRVVNVQAGAKSGLRGFGNFLAVVDHPWNYTEGGKWHPSTQLPLHSAGFDLVAALEYGTSAHAIPARAKGSPGARRGTTSPGVLRFRTTDGKWISTKRVAHPGTKAYGMARITAAESQVKLARRWQAVAAFGASAMGGG